MPRSKDWKSAENRQRYQTSRFRPFPFDYRTTRVTRPTRYHWAYGYKNKNTMQ